MFIHTPFSVNFFKQNIFYVGWDGNVTLTIIKPFLLHLVFLLRVVYLAFGDRSYFYAILVKLIQTHRDFFSNDLLSVLLRN